MAGVVFVVFDIADTLNNTAQPTDEVFVIVEEEQEEGGTGDSLPSSVLVAVPDG